MTHLSVVQHTQSEWLGHIEGHFEGRGIRFGYHRPFAAGGTLPDIATVGDGLLLVGGGPWGAASAGWLLPTLEAEIRLARACLMLGKPVVGFGLGAQVLCLAAEGRVEAAPLTLWAGEVRRTDPAALAGLLPGEIPAVVFMRDRFVPPAYAKTLAVDEHGHPAIFSIASGTLGFAGHPGVRTAMIEDLLMEFEEGPPDPAAVLPRIAGMARALEDALVPIMAGLIREAGWMPA